MDIKNVFENKGFSMPKLSDVRKVEKTGSAGKRTKNEFDDGSQLRIVKGIRVRSGYIIDGIGVIYEDGEGEFHGNKTGGAEHCCMLEEGDGIHSIEGVYEVPFLGSEAVSSLIIRTKKGKTFGPFGEGKSGSKFRFTLPEEAEFLGFHGSVEILGKFLSSIGMIYLK